MPGTDPHANSVGASLADDEHHAVGDDAPDASGAHGHGHHEAAETLGPPDLMAWAYALAGGAVGLVTAFALYLASHT